MLEYYLGDSCYQLGQVVPARRPPEEAYRHGYNKDEATALLIAICEAAGEAAQAKAYQEHLEARRQHYVPYWPDGTWLDAQPMGPRDPPNIGDRIIEPPSVDSYLRDYLSARRRLAASLPSVAAYHLERAIVIHIPLAERFSSTNALDCYRLLVQAYQQKAILVRSRNFRVDEVERDRREEAAAYVRKCLAEYGDREAAEADLLAEH